MVLRAVVTSAVDLVRLDGAHLDRLTVLRAREVAARSDAPAEGPLARIAILPMQAREAWTLAEVYGLPAREVARAMDCSTDAIRRHLATATDALAAARPEDEPAAALTAILRRWSMQQAPSIAVARRVHLRRYARHALRILLPVLGALVLFGGLAAIVWWLLGSATPAPSPDG